jgi:hemoglobin/transferrin/lactoferrin receptor protein
LDGSINYCVGRIVDVNGSQSPLDHISPLFGKLGFSYTNKYFNTDLFMLFNGKKPLDQFNTGGEDNAIYATKDGSPAWQTYNFKTSVQIAKQVALYAGVENILDIQFRTFSSGINAPGRNFYFAAKYSF